MEVIPDQKTKINSQLVNPSTKGKANAIIGKRVNSGSLQVSSSESQSQQIMQGKVAHKRIVKIEQIDHMPQSPHSFSSSEKDLKVPAVSTVDQIQ